MNQERYYEEDYRPRRSQVPSWAAGAVALAMLIPGIAFTLWLYPDIMPSRMTDPAPSGAVGNQAPPNVRGTNRGSDTRVSEAPQAAINAYNATAQAEYDAAVKAGDSNAPLVLQVATPLPLPLNSAGEPIINQEQANQQRLSLQLAEMEGAAAADAQLRAAREAAYAEQAGRAPDVSKEDAEKMMGRDLCHVPRADPHTCGQGLYKPTPVN